MPPGLLFGRSGAGVDDPAGVCRRTTAVTAVQHQDPRPPVRRLDGRGGARRPESHDDDVVFLRCRHHCSRRTDVICLATSRAVRRGAIRARACNTWASAPMITRYRSLAIPATIFLPAASGLVACTRRLPASSISTPEFFASSVATLPGNTVTTRTSVPTSSASRPSLNCFTAALLAL